MALGAVRYWGVGLDWTRWSWMSLPTQNSVKIQFQSGKESIAAKFLSGRSMEAKFDTPKSFPKHNLHLFYVLPWVSLRKPSTHKAPTEFLETARRRNVGFSLRIPSLLDSKLVKSQRTSSSRSRECLWAPSPLLSPSGVTWEGTRAGNAEFHPSSAARIK